MIGYYISCSDEVCDMFKPYVWGKHGIDTVMKIELSNDYGTDLNLLLIQYYVEGKFSNYLPIEPKLGNYKKDSKDITIAIGVTRKGFHEKEEFERREFVVDSTLLAIKLSKNKLFKKKLNIDFDKLLNDVKRVADEYLKYPEPYFP
ncbi:hypothetical protein HQ865_11510 [Mucilaginibacter mali]|uniref:Immunity protein 44 of polymorphic toxin system n=1 Tax=Mucilaginibacter mali TaxID=2740462 RepID=A0A7D4UAX0_9SPHI|nr:hypothetical protein [Mucilaginibacter mali]QKJ30358.1 hypothetical protein HQ865_11510 [Mucilaginibacter mali]